MGSSYTFLIKPLVEIIYFWILEPNAVNCLILEYASIVLQNLLTIYL
jgi:hypothetical protein